MLVNKLYIDYLPNVLRRKGIKCLIILEKGLVNIVNIDQYCACLKCTYSASVLDGITLSFEQKSIETLISILKLVKINDLQGFFLVSQLELQN